MEQMFLVKRQCCILRCYQNQYINSQGSGPCKKQPVVSSDYLSVSLHILQLAGAAFIAIGFWAWSEKVCEHWDIINMNVILLEDRILIIALCWLFMFKGHSEGSDSSDTTTWF